MNLTIITQILQCWVWWLHDHIVRRSIKRLKSGAEITSTTTAKKTLFDREKESAEKWSVVESISHETIEVTTQTFERNTPHTNKRRFKTCCNKIWSSMLLLHFRHILFQCQITVEQYIWVAFCYWFWPCNISSNEIQIWGRSCTSRSHQRCRCSWSHP